jgi:hypothetical protein
MRIVSINRPLTMAMLVKLLEEDTVNLVRPVSKQLCYHMSEV